MSNCRAMQYSDQMLCTCGLAWDVNDPDPPVCPAEGTTAPLSGSPESRKAVAMPDDVRAQIEDLK